MKKTVIAVLLACFTMVGTGAMADANWHCTTGYNQYGNSMCDIAGFTYYNPHTDSPYLDVNINNNGYSICDALRIDGDVEKLQLIQSALLSAFLSGKNIKFHYLSTLISDSTGFVLCKPDGILVGDAVK